MLLFELLPEVFPTQVPFFLSAKTLSPFAEPVFPEFLTLLEVLPLEALAAGLLVSLTP